jgi:hypothetical protein
MILDNASTLQYIFIIMRQRFTGHIVRRKSGSFDRGGSISWRSPAIIIKPGMSRHEAKVKRAITIVRSINSITIFSILLEGSAGR